MRISNRLLRVCLICGFAASLRADELTLTGGSSHLTGSVRSINEAGMVELASPISPQLLLLKGEAVEKVEFIGGGSAQEPPSMLVELANGDLLPAVVESLDERNLTVTSPEAGRLEIPRNALASMQLGIRKHQIVYSGPKSLDEWTTMEGDAKNWAYVAQGLAAKGPATASKEVALPRQFILRFSLKWDAGQVPNFQVHFADPLKSRGQRADRYYLQFGGAGLEIKREAAEGKRYNTIVQLNRTPNQYPEHRMAVEVRVDRDGSRMHLFIDDEPEGVFVDPIQPVPAGSGITLVCNGPNGSSQEIRGIEVLAFDDSRGRHRSEERGDPKNDSLISREEDRWGGRLLDIRKSQEGVMFRFKSDFQDEALEIPEADVSTVLFATQDTQPVDEKAHPFLLKLRGDGSLRVSSCRFTDATVSAIHPLLGPLELRREGIVAMERAEAKPKTKAKPKANAKPKPGP